MHLIDKVESSYPLHGLREKVLLLDEHGLKGREMNTLRLLDQ